MCPGGHYGHVHVYYGNLTQNNCLLCKVSHGDYGSLTYHKPFCGELTTQRGCESTNAVIDNDNIQVVLFETSERRVQSNRAWEPAYEYPETTSEVAGARLELT